MSVCWYLWVQSSESVSGVSEVVSEEQVSDALTTEQRFRHNHDTCCHQRKKIRTSHRETTENVFKNSM